VGREAIVAFLTRKWNRELDYRLIKEIWAFRENRIAVRFAYEWHDDSVSRGLRAVIRLESGGFRPAVTHKSDRGPVHSVQVRPASLAEWQKQVRIGILGQIRREFSEIEAQLQGDLDVRLITASPRSIMVGGAKSLIRFNSPIRCCSSPFTLNPSVT
jgi:hypothetical protein